MMSGSDEEQISHRETLVVLAMYEMLGDASVVGTLLALGMTDIVEEARALAQMERDEGGPDDEPLEDPEADGEFPEPVPGQEQSDE